MSADANNVELSVAPADTAIDQDADSTPLNPDPVPVKSKGSTAKKPPARRPARLNGFQKPHSQNQVFSWIMQSSLTALFWGITVYFWQSPASGPKDSIHGTLQLPLIIHSIAVAGGASCWYFLESHDPSIPSCWSAWLPKSERWTAVKYCAIHKKKIEGLDHHCTWLNTTVGRHNYVPFFILTLFGAVQFLTQFAVGIFLLIKSDGFVGAQVLLVLHTIGTFCVCGCYCLLLTFHLMLLHLGKNTYQFLQDRRYGKKIASLETRRWVTKHNRIEVTRPRQNRSK